MDPILQILLSWQFIFFGLAVAAIMYVVRLIVEYIFTLMKKSLNNSSFWNDLILPILPVVIGALGAYLLKIFPYPGFTDGPKGYVMAGDRVIFGLVAGLLSTLMYRVIKSLFYQKMVNLAQGLQSQNQSSTAPPPADNETVSTNQVPPRGQL